MQKNGYTALYSAQHKEIEDKIKGLEQARNEVQEMLDTVSAPRPQF